MFERLGEYWLPRVLFLATSACALALAGLVVLAPLIAAYHDGLPAWLRLFAVDAVVRRTVLGCAAGLITTAFVFFRPKGSFFARTPGGHDAPETDCQCFGG